MTSDDTDGSSVSDPLKEVLEGVHRVGPSTIKGFADADLNSIEDVTGLTPMEIEDRVDGVGFTTAQRIFEELASEGHSDYGGVKTDVSFTAVDEEFPTHVRPLLNEANDTAQSTRPQNVGQVTEMFDPDEFDSIEEWKEWYLTTSHEREELGGCSHGKTGEELIEDATDSTWEKIQEYKRVLEEVERETVERWVEELVLVKTPEGLTHESEVLEHLSEEFGMELTDSSAEEESEGIDGYLGDTGVSVKSAEYAVNERRGTVEAIDHPLVLYRVGENDGGDAERTLYLYYDEDELNLGE